MGSVAYSSFSSIWPQCLPYVRFIKPRADICHHCEVLRRQVSSAVSEAQKLAANRSFIAHLEEAQMEQDYYRLLTEEARKELSNFAPTCSPPPIPPCSAPVKKSTIYLVLPRT